MTSHDVIAHAGEHRDHVDEREAAVPGWGDTGLGETAASALETWRLT